MKKKAQPAPGGEIAVFQAPGGAVRVEVRLQRDTVWLSLDQLTALFGRDKSVISRHLKNIFVSKELRRSSVVAKNATTAADGKVYQVEYFNLDAIISVGYRVNSARATRFRQWATGVLRDHLVKGYTANQQRLRDLNQAVRLVADTAARRDLSGDEAQALLAVVGQYHRALDLLDDYDHQRITRPAAAGQVTHLLGYEEALRVVARLRERFAASAVFGIEKDKGLASALGAIMQTFDGTELYTGLEEKAAQLLYLLVKNHAFVDGNKRIAAALFLWFLERNGALLRADGSPRIPDSALVALTLMIAESRPREKDVLVRIVMHLLLGEVPA